MDPDTMATVATHAASTTGPLGTLIVGLAMWLRSEVKDIKRTLREAKNFARHNAARLVKVEKELGIPVAVPFDATPLPDEAS